MKSNGSWLRWSFIFFSLLGVFFVAFPLGHLFLTLSAREFLLALRNKEVWKALWTSFLGASGATILGFFFGAPAAYFLARYKLPARSILESFFHLPIVIPHVAVGIILLNTLHERAFLGRFFSFFHLTFVDTIYGVMVAMCFVSLSYVFSATLLGFRSLDRDLELAARTLGASPFYTFKKVTLPLIFPYLLRGAVMAFARSVSEVGALLILAYYPRTAPILLYETFENYGLQKARPITALLIFLSLFLFTLLMTLSKGIGKKDGA